MIQIDAGQQKSSSSNESETPSETSSESPPPPGGHPSTTPAPSVAHEPNPLTPSEIGTSGGHNLVEKVDSKTLPFARQTRRELPRIATNGTLGRPQPHQQHTVLTQLGLKCCKFQKFVNS